MIVWQVIDVMPSAKGKVKELQLDISAHLQDGRRGEILRSGIRLAIFGPPNAGKSSLLNYLGAYPAQPSTTVFVTSTDPTAQREAAIVTHLPGTTRDVLELSLDVAGMPVVVADTAGLRKTTDVVELLGIERAERTYVSPGTEKRRRLNKLLLRVATSDISLCVLSLPEVTSGTLPAGIGALIKPDTLILLNKADLAHHGEVDVSRILPTSCIHWTVSVNDGTGMQSFMNGLATVLRDRQVF